MAETYHGVTIPEEFWLSWNDPNAESVTGFRIGVISALGIPVNDDRNWRETERLEALASARDDAEEAAWQKEYDRKMEAWRAQHGQG